MVEKHDRKKPRKKTKFVMKKKREKQFFRVGMAESRNDRTKTIFYMKRIFVELLD